MPVVTHLIPIGEGAPLQPDATPASSVNSANSVKLGAPL